MKWQLQVMRWRGRKVIWPSGAQILSNPQKFKDILSITSCLVTAQLVLSYCRYCLWVVHKVTQIWRRQLEIMFPLNIISDGVNVVLCAEIQLTNRMSRTTACYWHSTMYDDKPESRSSSSTGDQSSPVSIRTISVYHYYVAYSIMEVIIISIIYFLTVFKQHSC